MYYTSKYNKFVLQPINRDSTQLIVFCLQQYTVTVVYRLLFGVSHVYATPSRSDGDIYLVVVCDRSLVRRLALGLIRVLGCEK